ncbi:MAG: class I SAM-dependent methyltransferase [Candidatus Helarchaeota archaeon]
MTDLKPKWDEYPADEIPFSLNLFPIFYKYVKKNFKILDVGTGNGRIALKLGLQGYHVYGIDINQNGIKSAKEKVLTQNLEEFVFFQVADAKNLPYEDNTFDMVIMQAFLTTITKKEDRNSIINESYRVLKNNGYLYIVAFGQTWHSELYRTRYLRDLPITKEEGSFLSYNKDTGEFEYIAHHYSEKELVFLLLNNGFKLDYFKHQELITKNSNITNGFIIIAKR